MSNKKLKQAPIKEIEEEATEVTEQTPIEEIEEEATEVIKSTKPTVELKITPNRNLQSAKAVMDWFGFSMIDIQTLDLKEHGLTDREIALLNIEYKSKVEKDIQYISTATTPKEVKEIMFKYGISLTVIKDKILLATFDLSKSELETINDYVTSLLS